MYYYKKNIGDYYKKTGRLSMLEHGAYTLLIDACYDRERFPTLDEAIDWSWARSDEEIDAVKFVLDRFFDFDGEVYIQSRIVDELAKYHQMAETNSRIAKQREEKRRERKQSVNESSTKRATGVNEAPPNQEPRTKNQEPRTKNQEPRTKNQDISDSDKPKRFNFKTALLNAGCDNGLADGFMAVRKTKKATNSEQAFNSFMGKVGESGMTLDQVLQVCIEKDWKGFDISWLKNQNTQTQNNRPPDIGNFMKTMGTDFLDVTPNQDYLEHKQ